MSCTKLVFIASSLKEKSDIDTSLFNLPQATTIVLTKQEVLCSGDPKRDIYEFIRHSGDIKEELEYLNKQLFSQVYFYYYDYPEYSELTRLNLDLELYTNCKSRYTLFSPFYTPYIQVEPIDIVYRVPLPIYWFSDSLTYSIISKFDTSYMERGHRRVDLIQKKFPTCFDEFYFANYLGMFNITYRHV